MSTTTFEYHPKCSQKLDPTVIEMVKSLHEAGYSNVEIGKMVGRHNSNIARLLKKESSISVNKDMNKKNPRKAKESPKRVSGVRAPERVASGEPEAGPSSSEGFQEKIARLEEELRGMRLERDLYREIIDVAERRYNVPILKKSGVKQ
jgi:hypothetical protein